MKVENKLISFIFNKLDLPVRLLYSQLHLNKLFFWKLYSSDLDELDKHFENMKDIVLNSGYSFESKICLELGPGNSYINAYNFLANGAKKVILVDKYPRYSNTKKQKGYIRREIDYVQSKYNRKINNKNIIFIAEDLRELNLGEKIDFAYSISVFEHIKDVEGSIQRLGEIIKQGGLMYHSIDMRDHYNFNNPFLFLKYSKRTWDKYLTKEGVSYTNRTRYSELYRLFEKYNFEIISEQTERYPVGGVKIHKEIDKNDQYLNVGLWRVLLRKK